MRGVALIASIILLLASASACCGELEERARISAAAIDAFAKGRVEELEASSRRYVRERTRTPSGTWALGAFYLGIMELPTSELSPDRAQAMAKRWIERYPKSASARVAYAEILRRTAGDAEAERYLKQHKSIAAGDPHAYELLMAFSSGAGRPQREVDILFEEAVAREPLYYQNYFAVAKDRMMRAGYGGPDPKTIAALAEDAVARTRSSDGESMYARIYWLLYSRPENGPAFAASSKEVWPRMKRGFEALVARYPDAWNLNHYARFACLAGDDPTAAALIEEISGRRSVDAWSESSYSQCAVRTRAMREAIRQRKLAAPSGVRGT
jgi:hypothetical protein